MKSPWSITLWALIFALAVLSVISLANAQPSPEGSPAPRPCPTIKAQDQNIRRTYHEMPFMTTMKLAVLPTGQKIMIREVTYLNRESGTMTVVRIVGNVACIVGAGVRTRVIWGDPA